MKLFWGLYETHDHSYDPTKWENVGEYERYNFDMLGDKQIIGYVEYFQNTCLTCGDLIEKAMKR
jgi:hypothetical protein